MLQGKSDNLLSCIDVSLKSSKAALKSIVVYTSQAYISVWLQDLRDLHQQIHNMTQISLRYIYF